MSTNWMDAYLEWADAQQDIPHSNLFGYRDCDCYSLMVSPHVFKAMKSKIGTPEMSGVEENSSGLRLYYNHPTLNLILRISEHEDGFYGDDMIHEVVPAPITVSERGRRWAKVHGPLPRRTLRG